VSKQEVLDAVTDYWIEEFGELRNDDQERDGSFVVGFVRCALESKEKETEND